MLHTISERVLICGAGGMLAAALALAWLATFARLMPLAPVRGVVRDYPSIIRAHIDLLLMALFCLAFARLQIALPVPACVLVVVGGFTNPSLFVLRGVAPGVSGSRVMRLYRPASFAVSTAGFAWVTAAMVADVLR